jgi:hypothetical protein
MKWALETSNEDEQSTMIFFIQLTAKEEKKITKTPKKIFILKEEKKSH